MGEWRFSVTVAYSQTSVSGQLSAVSPKLMATDEVESKGVETEILKSIKKGDSETFLRTTADKKEIKDFPKFAYRQTSFIRKPLGEKISAMT